MNQTSYFIEGLQGSGKSTFVRHLSQKLKEYEVFHEWDYSPVELAWCAYVTGDQYEDILKKFPDLKEEIINKTVAEGNRKIICYTQILTDTEGFYKDLEQYEIYNGNLDKKQFEDVILKRYADWTGKNQIFECSVFQNIIENQLLYLMMSEDEIVGFYRKLKAVMQGKTYKIVYLDSEDILRDIEIIKKERSDDEGNELWFPLMIRYLEDSPYGKKHSLHGMDSLIAHLERRRNLEHRLINEIFMDHAMVLKAKAYDLDSVLAKLIKNDPQKG